MRLYKLALASILVLSASSTAYAQLIDTAPTPTAEVPGTDAGASVMIETATQLFITRLDAHINVIVPTNAKFVIWNATTGAIVHETTTLALGVAGPQFVQSPALAFNTIANGRYVIALMTQNIGEVRWFTDTAAENQNHIKTLQKGDIQTNFATPNTPPKQAGNFDARIRIHGFLLNDADGDTIINETDNCPFQANTDQADKDMDGIGNTCDKRNDKDVDDDGKENTEDNCPFHDNPDQKDSDMDGIGDVCDAGSGASDGDPDGDGITNATDNCPFSANPSQSDADGDGRGDECDLQIIVDGSGCATSNGSSLGLALLLLGLVLRRRARA